MRGFHETVWCRSDSGSLLDPDGRSPEVQFRRKQSLANLIRGGNLNRFPMENVSIDDNGMVTFKYERNFGRMINSEMKLKKIFDKNPKLKKLLERDRARK